ncbi:MAG: class I SAM-dependent methyltransferase [Limisphaerales bacterium]
MAPKNQEIYECHLCQSRDLDVAQNYSSYCRVTSDCKSWPAGGTLAYCRACSLVQNVTTSRWKKEADCIYNNYTIYHQSGGVEQMVFINEQPAARSEVICNFIKQKHDLPLHGRLLDIGCGNGAFLRVYSRLLPGWKLYGSEFDAKYKDMVEAIPNVEMMFPGDLSEIPGEFDLISLIHVFEHIPSPLKVLERIWDKLKPGGLLLIQVPDCLKNPYMLLVADHCSHFSVGTLSKLASLAGFEVLYSESECIPKELTLVARKMAIKFTLPTTFKLDNIEGEKVFSGARWLKRVIQAAESVAAKDQNFGIFGSSIAATWLQSQIGNTAKFFVDEDPNRAGRSHMGIPILTPPEVSAGATIIIPLPEIVAKAIIGRLRAQNKTLQICLP